MNPYMNGGGSGYTFAGADGNGLPGKSVNGNSTWDDRNTSMGNNPMGNNPMGGFAYYHATQDEEYEDPLVCAAPVVAFGRGW